MNKLLRRQIAKHLGSMSTPPAALRPLFAAINDAYDGFDADRRLVERSLDISSQELMEINDRLRKEIADHEMTDHNLRNSVSLLATTLESTADGILVDDREGQIKGFNSKFVTMWQIPKSILASGQIGQVLSFGMEQVKDPAAFQASVLRFRANPMSEDNDVVYLKNGHVFDMYSKPQILEGRIIGRVWSFRDITAQSRLLQELENANQQLAKANKELNDFAYVVSHDLKAPLRGIKTLAGWIASDCVDRLDAEAKEQLSLMLNRVDRMHDLIDGILQYSRIGRVTEDRVQIDLNKLVPEVVDLLAAPEHIEIAIRDELPAVECERTRITQVFQNLVGNAIKHMGKPHGHIAIDCRGSEDEWVFSVADDGPGIEEKHFERIFQLFQTLSSRDDRKSTGIGLTLVKKIVELNGGRVWVESTPGEGSTFFFTLPQRIQGERRNEELQTCAVG